MLVAVGDTHAESSPKLTTHLRERLAEAGPVVHTGDFTTERVLDAFESETDLFAGVAGNRDSAAVRSRLPETRSLRWGDRTLLVAHGHRHDNTALSILARQEKADLAIVGHTHRPAIEYVDGLPVVNPGSYADPRQFDPGYATLRQFDDGDRLRVRLRTPDGDPLASAEL
jgi:putative phosphoesterase